MKCDPFAIRAAQETSALGSVVDREAEISDRTGVVVLDTNALKVFEPAEIRNRLCRVLDTANYAVWPSALNVLEIVKTGNPRVRQRLLATTLALSGTRSVLPMPRQLLKRVGEAIIAGEDGFRTTRTGLEWIVREPERIMDHHVAEASRILSRSQQAWEQAYRLGRRTIRAALKGAEVRDPWAGIGAFLDRHWTRVQQLDTFIDRLWSGFELPAPAPYEAVLQNEVWRLYFEGLGATIYERCVPSQPLPPAHVADVLQLVYMAGAQRRILVTDDAGLHRVASAVLIGRYSGTSVMGTAEFLATAPQ